MGISSTTLMAASLLSADFADIIGSVKRIEKAGADWIHLDVMDGVFVPNLTFGPKMVADLRKRTSLPLDVHLMTVHPESLVDEFASAGANYLTFHLESTVHAHRLLTNIKERGMRAGITTVPSTPASALSEVLDLVDLILVMTVNPGFGGQELIPACLDKVRFFDRLRKEKGYTYRLEVDGGVNRRTAADIRQAGADVLVSGTAFFSSMDAEEEVQILKGIKHL